MDNCFYNIKGRCNCENNQHTVCIGPMCSDYILKDSSTCMYSIDSHICGYPYCPHYNQVCFCQSVEECKHYIKYEPRVDCVFDDRGYCRHMDSLYFERECGWPSDHKRCNCAVFPDEDHNEEYKVRAEDAIKEFLTDIHKNDAVNHPNHYCKGGIECIEAIKASMTPEEFQGYCKGNVEKYVWRWREKAGLQDLKKAQVYLGWLIESVEEHPSVRVNNEQ